MTIVMTANHRARMVCRIASSPHPRGAVAIKPCARRVDYSRDLAPAQGENKQDCQDE